MTINQQPDTQFWGICEWYGKDISEYKSEQRRDLAELSLSRLGIKPACPYMSSVIPNSKCNKRGGVCSIQPYKLINHVTNMTSEVIQLSPVVTTCPQRFLQENAIFREIGKIVLGTDEPWIIKEEPFLKKLNTATSGDDSDKMAGRIDWILATETKAGLDWCAVETQSLYFSGDSMVPYFEAYLYSDNGSLLFPVGKRRPDYRSSGAKRLAPQLQVKVPVLSNWGRKTVVVIDRYFFDNMSDLKELSIKQNGIHSEQDLLDNSQIVWIIVDYDSNGEIYVCKYLYTNLIDSIDALNATKAVSKQTFEKKLQVLVSGGPKNSKVFKI